MSATFFPENFAAVSDDFAPPTLQAGPEADCREGGAESGRSKKASGGSGSGGGGTGLGRLFRTLGSKKERCKTSPRHLASRLRPAAIGATSACRQPDASAAQLQWAAPPEVSPPSSGLQQPGLDEELLTDDRCLQLMLAVREGHMTGDQALNRIRQRGTLRFRNNRNREELLNDLARSLVWNQGGPKKAQANSVFYTDGLAPTTGGCLGPCRGPMGLSAPAQPIYYEPPDAVGLVATGSPLRTAVMMPAPGSSSSSSSSSVLVSDRCCGTSTTSSTIPRPNAIVSPFRAPKPVSDPGPATTAPVYGTTTEVCDGNCGNIMCSVRASSDGSPPSSEPSTLLPPGHTTVLTSSSKASSPPGASDLVNDDDDGCCRGDVNAGGDVKRDCKNDGSPTGDGGGAQRTVPDVAHDSELKRAALAAAAAAGGAGDKPASDDVRATTFGAAVGSASSVVAAGSVTGGAPSVESSSANVRVVTMLGKLRGRTPTRNSYSASEEGQSQSSDYEDQEEAEKQMGEAQKTPDQQLRNSLVGRVRHLHKDVKKKISRFRNSRSSVDGTMEDKDLPDEVLQPGSSVESIPSGSVGSRSSIQAHTPTSSNRSSSSIGEEECNPQCFGPFVGRARALVDCVPSPYDKDGLAFKKGDIIDILSKNTTGTWVGVANKKVGHFKFINVEEIPTETKPRKRRFPSVPKLEQRPESLEELLGMFSLQNYVNVFMLHGYQDLDTFKEITKEDLESLGINNEDHQMQILRAAEALLEHDGEILGEYLEAPVSPELPPVKEGDADLTLDSVINDLDSAPSAFQNNQKAFAATGDGDSSLNNGSNLLRFPMNIPVPEPDSPPAFATRCDDSKERAFNGTNTPPLPSSIVSAAVERFELRRASAECIRNHIPKSLQNVFRKLSGNGGDDDGRSASFDEEALAESPAKTSYGSSFARKVKASAFLRRDSHDPRKASDRKASLHNAEETAAAAALSLHMCIEHKLAAEGIDLCQEPYTDKTGFCGIPPALVQRYSEELQRDIAETAEALDQIRITELDRIGKQGVPNDFLADSCHGSSVDADYSGGLRPWLVSLGLPMYEPLFLEARLCDLARIAQLQEQDLRALGISNVRHVRHLAAAIGALQMEQSRYGLELR
uniref:SAM domain (Sterile alpha motif) domain containing protein n=1 Tax=Rhipicephalus appendiculatus TaxID=34631 RepID=A0A131YGV8_RHIAP